jgi:hypothetical protein
VVVAVVTPEDLCRAWNLRWDGWDDWDDLPRPKALAKHRWIPKRDRRPSRREPRIDGICALYINGVVRGSGATTATCESGKAEQRKSAWSWYGQPFKVDDASPVVGCCTAGVAIIETDGPRTGAIEAE